MKKNPQLNLPKQLLFPNTSARKRTHDEWMNNLPVKEEHHKIDNPVCEICGAEMEELTPEKAYDELIFTPPKYHIRRHIVHKYKCPECGEKPRRKGRTLSYHPCAISSRYDPGKLLLSRTSGSYHLRKICKVSTSAPSGKGL
ncbi:IS66 family transposase zinc-finger binding domain-containing protein [Ruminococcus albus]|uniref:IS66 family transposase zinc-finger binding domain-containing protein n=1 Tax=Ruminococcus albus TaxID=1264 RepID=UPI001FA7C80C|nr:IS66 family transposase zinc-finger binding domain-containing protein [Ruminococcus albus]